MTERDYRIAWKSHQQGPIYVEKKTNFKDHLQGSPRWQRPGREDQPPCGAVLTMINRNANDLVTADAKVAEFTCSKVWAVRCLREGRSHQAEVGTSSFCNLGTLCCVRASFRAIVPSLFDAGGVVFFFGWYVIEMHENWVVAPRLVWIDDQELATHLVQSMSADEPLLFAQKHLQEVTHTSFQSQQFAPSHHENLQLTACLLDERWFG